MWYLREQLSSGTKVQTIRLLRPRGQPLFLLQYLTSRVVEDSQGLFSPQKFLIESSSKMRLSA